MVLIDDPEKTIIEPLFNKQYPKIYDTDLMMNGGHISGYKIADEENIQKIVKGLEALADKKGFQEKYAVPENL